MDCNCLYGIIVILGIFGFGFYFIYSIFKGIDI